MKMQRLLSYVRRAVQDYDMIQDGDRIAVGISGGKDSLTLLMALKGLQRFYPKKFEIEWPLLLVLVLKVWIFLLYKNSVMN